MGKKIGRIMGRSEKKKCERVGGEGNRAMDSKLFGRSGIGRPVLSR